VLLLHRSGTPLADKAVSFTQFFREAHRRGGGGDQDGEAADNAARPSRRRPRHGRFIADLQESFAIAVYSASLSAGRIAGPDFEAPCALGEAGVIAAADKREGDAKSPLGVWRVRKAWWRADRLARPATALVMDALGEADGWCDDPGDPAYNRAVLRPYAASHEAMWREDGLYDIVVALGHNDDPPVPGLGSAIFLHCALPRDNGRLKPTLGCAAIPRDRLVDLLGRMTTADAIEITP